MTSSDQSYFNHLRMPTFSCASEATAPSNDSMQPKYYGHKMAIEIV